MTLPYIVDKRSGTPIALFTACLGYFLLCGTAFPQAIAARDTIAIDRDMRREASDLMEGEYTQPKEEQKKEEKIIPKGIQVYISKIILVGVESFPPETFDELKNTCEGRKVARNELEVLTKKIQREYLRRGIIAACFVPPQEVRNGVITFQVVEAKMGDLTVTGNAFFDDDLLRSMWTSKYGEVLRYNKIAKNLDIINKNPDRTVSVALQAGEKPETTDVVLNSATELPYHFTASYDQEGNYKTGRQRKGFGIRSNNFLFADDMLISGYTFGTDFSSIYFYHKVPITNLGTSVMYGHSFSKSAPKKDQEPIGLTSLSSSSSLFFYQDIYRGRDSLGNLQWGFDFKDKTVKYNSGTFSRDRITTMRLAGKFTYPFLKGLLTIAPEYSQGLNFLGARRKTKLSSRNNGVDAGIENVYSKFYMESSYIRSLPYELRANIKFQGQFSDKKLGSQEELSLGGINSVRGFPSSDFLADDGAILNCELQFPMYFLPRDLRVPYGERPLRDEITGLVFIDYGHGQRKGVLDSEIFSSRGATKREVNYFSFGAGLRVHLLDQAYLRLEWGKPIAGNRPISESSPSRIHFAVDLEEHLPRELKSLKERYQEEEERKLAWKLLDKELNKEGSIPRAYLFDLKNMADKAHIKGALKEEKMWNSKILSTSQSLIQQAYNYIRSLFNKEQELSRKKELAQQYLDRGEFAKAKAVWESILTEDHFHDLTFTIKI